MQFDLPTLPFAVRYKILNSTVTPRPIAWTVTLDETGVPNCAPHSFFNVLGCDPAMIVLGLVKIGGADKDTASHVRARGEFTVALVSEADAERMNLTAAPVPRGVDELALAGIATVAAATVSPPLIASAPVSFECRVLDLLDYVGQSVVIAEVLVAHIADNFMTDPVEVHFNTPAMKLIGRTHGAGWYQRNSNQFEMERPSMEALAAFSSQAGTSP